MEGKILTSWTRAASSLFYTKKSSVSPIRVISDIETGDEKRTGEVPTKDDHIVCAQMGLH